MWSKMGYNLYSLECKSIMKRFETLDGFINYKAFINFAKLQNQPCTKHGRFVCTDCIIYQKYSNHLQNKHYFVPCRRHPLFCASCGLYKARHTVIPKPQLDTFCKPNHHKYTIRICDKDHFHRILHRRRKPDVLSTKCLKAIPLNEVIQNIDKHQTQKYE